MKQVMQIMTSSYSLNTMRVYILPTMCFSDIFRKKKFLYRLNCFCMLYLKVILIYHFYPTIFIS